jgi:cysteinyl-tRNA synthetase
MLKFYNSLTNKKETFTPIHRAEVKLYTCGPTVYDKAHIGNFRTFLFEDLLKRTLLAFGYKVKHIMNITDIDDKTIKKANESNKNLSQITEHYTKLFFEDSLSLKILPADNYPLATEHIPGMIEMIKSLINKKFAYVTEDGSVFFKISSYSKYGNLTNINMAKMKKSTRVLSDEYNLDSPQDFALWKAYKNADGNIFWNSPWGKGRPGWHIECSSMSVEYLGKHFDIHCGGFDNKFPHHENEIAQSECALDTEFVNYWLHSELLLVDGGKMSKSLGNVYTIPELFNKGFTPEEIRYIMLTAHYRSKVNFTLKKQHEAKMGIKRIQTLKSRLQSINRFNTNAYPDIKNVFDKTLSDDLDTPNGMALVFDWVRKLNIDLDKDNLTEEAAAGSLNFINYFNSIFNVLIDDSSIPTEILKLAEARKIARKNKDWDESDRLRDLIDSKGWNIRDYNEGQKIFLK